MDAETVRIAFEEAYDGWTAAEVDLAGGFLIATRGDEVRRVTFTVASDGTIAFGPFEATDGILFQQVSEAGQFMAASAPTGAVWDVRILKFGRSKNGWDWKPEIGPQLVEHLKDAPIGLYGHVSGAGHAPEEDIRAAKGPIIRNIVGAVKHPYLKSDGVYGEAHIGESAGWLRTKLLDLVPKGLLGLSVDTDTLANAVSGAIKTVRDVISVDVVSRPSAGGEFIRATAGLALEEEQGMDKAVLFAAIKESRPKLVEGKKLEDLTDEQFSMLIREAFKTPPPDDPKPKPDPEPKPKPEPATKPQWAIDAEIRDTRARVREALDATKLPGPVKDKVRRHFDGKVSTDAEIQAHVKEEVETWGKLDASGDVVGNGHTRAEVVVASMDKLQAGMDQLFGVTPDMVKRAVDAAPVSAAYRQRIREAWTPKETSPGMAFKSIQHAYLMLTGDESFEGKFVRSRVSEATVLSTTFPNLMGNTLNRMLLGAYAFPGYNEETIAKFGSASDFKLIQRNRLGYFANIPVVAEAGPYTEATIPAEELVSYVVQKRGELLPFTWEMLRNDDINTVATLVERWGQAARRTVAQFIWNFWINNSAFDVDTVAWFNAAHGNISAVALTANAAGAAEVFAKIQQLAVMTAPGSSEKLGRPEMDRLYLMVPIELWSIARQLNLTPEFGAGVINPIYGLFGAPTAAGAERIIVNTLLTDANDWGVHVAPGSGGRDSLEVDFLDGQQTPTLVLADDPTQGTMFTHDKLQYKLRFVWGGDILDVKGATKSVVA